MKKKIGLVLSGGGVRGAYQIGAYMALKKLGIKFNCVVGTSIGSFNGAMIASHNENKLLKFWQNIDVANFLEIDPTLETAKLDLKVIDTIFRTAKDKINNGFNIQPLRNELTKMLKERKLRRSNIDFGLVTLNADSLTPVRIFINEMPKGMVINYILASCFLPIFKKEELVDNAYYMDGGFVDNCPIKMLEKFNCQKIYVIDLKAIGVIKRAKMESDVIYLKPSRNLGSILTINKKIITNNIKLGYYDTLTTLGKLDGRVYNFKLKSKKYYQCLLRKVSDSELRKAELHYKTTNPKKLLIRMFEFILKKENKDIYHIYKPRDIIKIAKKQRNVDNFQYNFVRNLK